MAKVEYKALPPQEAVEFFKSKGYKFGFDWRDAWQEEHSQAFTVAKAMRADLLADIRQEVEAALTQGTTLRQFQKQLTPILQAKGWWGKKFVTDPNTGEQVKAQLGSPRRLRVVFDTNLRMAYATGRWERIKRQAKTRPYLRYTAVLDDRNRPQHRAWHGTILRANHPWWNTHAPPNGWFCRCKVISLSERQMKRRGWKQSPDPSVEVREWTNKRTGEVLQVPKGIDPGFAYNPGKGRGFKGPPAPPPDPNKIPELDPKMALERHVAGQKGSNEGGFYRGGDGVTRYVKFYQDSTQSYNEAVANRIYRELGIQAPKSALVRREGKLALASEIIDNSGTLGKTARTLTKARAEKVLQGFAADVWLANWDAVGLSLDNIVLAGNKLARIDQGGSLLFRARAGRKPLERLEKLSEWEGFAPGGRNPAYTKVFEKAGLASADELGNRAIRQINEIKKLGKRTRNFADLVPKVKGISEDDRKAILDLLRRRARLLETQIIPQIREALKQAGDLPAHELSIKRRMGAQFRQLLNAGLSKIRAGAPRHGMSDAELAVLYAYTTSGTWGYGRINRALRAGRRTENDYRDTLNSALSKLPVKTGRMTRGATLPAGKVEEYKRVGNTVTEEAFTSSATGQTRFGGDHFLVVQSRNGRSVKEYSAYRSENEVLFAAGSRFKVLEVEHLGGRRYKFVVEQVD